MANTDPVEFVLYSSDLVTELAILPVISGHLYMEFQEPGSGDVLIPFASSAAAQVSNGQFVLINYRGAARGGFFVDNIKPTEANESEYKGRTMSISGRGPLAILDDAIAWDDGSGTSTRSFTGKTKAYILKTLIDEAVTRGALSRLDYDFTATVDSSSVAWADSEDYDINVGKSLLEVLRMFAQTGDMEFAVTLQGGSKPILLSAYKNGTGTDLSSTIYMRIGANCEEVTTDERGDELKNVYLIKYKDGYAKVTNSTSISARRRREAFLSLETAQSSGSATTYASAKLDTTKDPKQSISVRVYDGVKPYLFADYGMGDTITLDKIGTQISKRVLGIQADFDGETWSHVVLELNIILYDNELRMKHQLDWLQDQWNTAKDDNLTEVKQWLSIGSPNGEVYALHSYGNYLYVGGAFTAITGRVAASYIAQYNLTTGQWSTMTSTITTPVYAITDVSGVIYACTEHKVYEWNGSAWTLVGSSPTNSTTIYTACSDGTHLYIGGEGGNDWAGGTVNIRDGVASYLGSWTSLDNGSGITPDAVRAMAYFDSHLYIGRRGHTAPHLSSLQYWDGSDWQDKFTGYVHIEALAAVNSRLYWYEGNGGTFYLYYWDGGVSATLAGTVTDEVEEGLETHSALAGYLSDAYLGGEFTTIEGTAGFNNITKYSGSLFTSLGSGTSIARPAGNDDRVNALAVVGDDIYAGGLFTTAGGKSIANLAVWITSFESLVSHLSNGASFDLGAAIHGATAITTPTNNDEFPLWEDTSQDLRKVTWANIKSTLKTYFDTIYGVFLDAVNVFARQQQIVNATNGEGGLYVQTIGDAYPVDAEQYTVGDNVTSPVLFAYRETSGAGNITAPAIEILQAASGAGTITGDILQAHTSGGNLIRILGDGSVRLPQIADGSAVNDSLYYSTTAGKLAYKDSGGTVHALY
jgi:hypothetical protein